MAEPAERKINSFKDLVAWQKGMALVKKIYLLTGSFPLEERFGLVSQMRRAAVSIPSNVAEGQSRRTTGEFVQGVSQAEGSLAELETQVLLGIDLGFCLSADAAPSLSEINELQRMLRSLRHKLCARRATATNS